MRKWCYPVFCSVDSSVACRAHSFGPDAGDGVLLAAQKSGPGVSFLCFDCNERHDGLAVF